jgi:hypothetical protein
MSEIKTRNFDDGETAQQPHPQRCETCKKRETLQCPIQDEDVYYKIKEQVTVPTGWEILTSVIGCVSHSSTRPHTPAPERIIGKQTCEAFDDSKFPVFVQGTGWISLIDAKRLFASEAARAATLAENKRVLDELVPVMKRLFDGGCYKYDSGYCLTTTFLSCRKCFNEYIESLRQQAGEQG